jgi:undecaprenyl-diphosphatase
MPHAGTAAPGAKSIRMHLIGALRIIMAQHRPGPVVAEPRAAGRFRLLRPLAFAIAGNRLSCALADAASGDAGHVRDRHMHELAVAALLGVIEGITEFLPVSSTGHLLIAEHWLGARSELFNVVIQAGAILAVALIYRRRLWQLADLRQPAQRDYAMKLSLAFLITAVLGFVVTRLGFTLPETVAPVAWALVIGGLWMLAAEWYAAGLPERSDVSWRVAVLVGLAQVVAAVFPGTSRSAATIFIALIAGTSNRSAATEFAFLVGIPTMFAASGYEILKQWHSGATHEDWGALAIAFVAATVTAFVAVSWLLGYLRQHRFTGFAIYRIVLGVALLAWV